MQGAAMYEGIVTDGNPVANLRRGLLKGAVNHCSILDVHPIANPDAVHISSYNGIVPDAAVITHDYIANYNSGFGQKAVCSHLRTDSLEGFDEGHVCVEF
jgi:hypothetical protein